MFELYQPAWYQETLDAVRRQNERIKGNPEEARQFLLGIGAVKVKELMKTYETPKFDAATAKPYEAQLMQLMTTTSDGDLISRQARDLAVDNDMCVRLEGFNMITPQGVKYLLSLDMIHV